MIKVMFVCKNFCFIHFKYIKIIIITHFFHVYLVMLLLVVVIIRKLAGLMNPCAQHQHIPTG